MRVAALLASLSILVFAQVAWAEAPVKVEKEKQSLEDFAASHPSCREWTDGCLICVRKGDGSFVCSLPGIACQPAKLSCGRAMMSPETKPSQPAPEPTKK